MLLFEMTAEPLCFHLIMKTAGALRFRVALFDMTIISMYINRYFPVSFLLLFYFAAVFYVIVTLLTRLAGPF